MKSAKTLVLTLITCIAIMLASNAALSAEEKTIDEIKATFITNYVSYVKWPKTKLVKNNTVNICTLEGDSTAIYLKQIAKEYNNSHKIRVKQKGKHATMNECHILYISELHKLDVAYFIKTTKGRPILTISDTKNFSKKGGITGFQIRNGNVTLEANITSLKAAKIEMSTDLLAIMKVFK